MYIFGDFPLVMKTALRLPRRAAFAAFSRACRRHCPHAARKPRRVRIAPGPVRQERVSYACFPKISRAAGHKQTESPPPRPPPEREEFTVVAGSDRSAYPRPCPSISDHAI